MQPLQEALLAQPNTQYSYSIAERAHHGQTLTLGINFFSGFPINVNNKMQSIARVNSRIANRLLL
jgi:hypothetical protein